MIGTDLFRTHMCRTEKWVFDVAEEWRVESEARGWAGANRPSDLG
jgi:hypothetical protein